MGESSAKLTRVGSSQSRKTKKGERKEVGRPRQSSPALGDLLYNNIVSNLHVMIPLLPAGRARSSEGLVSDD